MNVQFLITVLDFIKENIELSAQVFAFSVLIWC